MISLKWKDVAEVLGLTAVLFGMYFVHAEIQQNGIIARLELAISIREQRDEINRIQLDPEFSVLYLKGMHNPTELDEYERHRLNTYFDSLISLMTAEFHTYRLGVFVEHEPLQRDFARRYFAHGYGRAYWNVRKRSFLLSQVVAIVEDELSTIDSKPRQILDEEILRQLANP